MHGSLIQRPTSWPNLLSFVKLAYTNFKRFEQICGSNIFVAHLSMLTTQWLKSVILVQLSCVYLCRRGDIYNECLRYTIYRKIVNKFLSSVYSWIVWYGVYEWKNSFGIVGLYERSQMTIWILKHHVTIVIIYDGYFWYSSCYCYTVLTKWFQEWDRYISRLLRFPIHNSHRTKKSHLFRLISYSHIYLYINVVGKIPTSTIFAKSRWKRKKTWLFNAYDVM